MLEHGLLPCYALVRALRSGNFRSRPDCLAVEMIASYGMAVGASVFETCTWIGRFEEAWAARRCESEMHRVKRHEVKMAVCHDSRAKDANIRQALLDRWGGKEQAVGTKKRPGPLYGVKKDIWAALAVAVTQGDKSEPDSV